MDAIAVAEKLLAGKDFEVENLPDGDTDTEKEDQEEEEEPEFFKNQPK